MNHESQQPPHNDRETETSHHGTLGEYMSTARGGEGFSAPSPADDDPRELSTDRAPVPDDTPQIGLDSEAQKSVNQEDVTGGTPTMNPGLTTTTINPFGAIADALTPKVAVSYLRVSTKRQAERGDEAEGFSIPAQRDANRKKAQSLGAFIVKEFVDRGESARSANRPELQRMLEYIRENDVDYVIVHKVDRLARNREDDVEINRALTDAGVTLVSTTESIDQSPSGMLLHGIMASIAEFYSRNLANEVVKGMSQKARRGGTIGRAPLGYRNTSQMGEDGREARTVVLDPERASLIRWAFEEYAKGERGLKSIADELAARGLRTLKTPNVPSKVLDENGLQKLLTKPYYTGVVTFQGVTYPGRHPAIIDDETFQLVQQVLASRRVGERRRTHDHYLKSTLRCGICGSRLIVQMTRNSKGTLYPYFVCNGRFGKKNGCELKAVLIDETEVRAENHYAELARLITPEFRAKVEAIIELEFRDSRAEVDRALKHLRSEREKLEREQERVLQAHYADAIPLDLLKKEQDRIAYALRENARQVDKYTANLDAVEGSMRPALDLLEDCPKAYQLAPDHIRKLMNQVFFEHILVFNDGGTKAEMLEPFATITSLEVQLAAEQHVASRQTAGNTKSSTSPKGRAALTINLPGPTDPHPRVFSGICFGSNLLVRLLHHYSKQLSMPATEVTSPGKLLVRARNDASKTTSPPTAASPAKWSRGGSKLRDHEIDRVVELYEHLESVREVARELGIARTTVGRYLALRGIETRHHMSDADVKLAVQQYEGGQSSNEIAQRLGFDNHTVLSALRGAGVRIRPRYGH